MIPTIPLVLSNQGLGQLRSSPTRRATVMASVKSIRNRAVEMRETSRSMKMPEKSTSSNQT